MLRPIAPEKADALLRAGEARLIDIRDPEEFARLSIPQARLIPLSVIGRHPLKDEGAAELPVIFTCRSGKRTARAEQTLARLAPGAYQLDGGISAWERAGLPVERAHMPLPLFRQIQIGAGGLVLLGSLGGLFWPPLYWLSAFVGAGLVFAGTTGFCGLGVLLSRMPWNRTRP